MESKELEEIVNELPAEEMLEQQPVQETLSTKQQIQKAADVAKDGAAKVANTAVKTVKKLGKKVWIIAAAIVAVLVAVIVLVSVMSNTYRTPLNLLMKQQNSRKTPKSFSETTSLLNGFSEKEMKVLFDIIEQSDEYEERLEDMQDAFEKQVEDYEDEYGRNYKFSYVIDYKEELEKEDLRKFRDLVKTMAEVIEERVEITEDWDSDDWEDEAEETGLTKSEMKSLIRAMEDLSDAWNDIEITKGYELTVLKTIDGSELDEPEEEEMTILVFKVNGRWIASNAMTSVISQVNI